MKLRSFFDAWQPFIVGIVVLALWEIVVRVKGVPHYVLPPPSMILAALAANWSTLQNNLAITLAITGAALVGAIVIGLAVAVIFAESRFAERSFFPYAVILQVTPVVSIAPLIIIWVSDTFSALFICAWLVAFFPVVSNTTIGLKSVDPNLRDLFSIYGATRRQALWYLMLPSAMPYFLAGARISGGLALIGSVVAEFVAGTAGTQSGLAYRILESGFRLEMPKMFAALFLISATGIAIYLATTFVSRMVLGHWHESSTHER
jgi:NitT/TauT family transport system permease protein